MNEDELYESCERKLEPYCRQGVELRVKSGKAAKGTSKIGGHPDLPEDVEWPLWKTHPLAFVAQIDLARIAKFDSEKLLPKDGLLSLFILDVRYAMVKGAPMDHARVIHLPKGKKLVQRAPPETLAPELAIGEGKLSFKKVDTWPQVEGSIVGGRKNPGVVKLMPEEYEVWAAQRLEPPEDLMLGHPRGVEFPIGTSPDARLLFQSGRRWNIGGRNGFLYLYGSKDAIRDRRWDEIRMKQW